MLLSEPFQTTQAEGDAQASTGLAVKPVAEQGFGALEPVGDGPIGQVEPASGLAAVLAGVEEHLERLDQFIAHPWIGEERSQFAFDDRRCKLRIAQEESLDTELGEIIDETSSTDPGRDPQALLELKQASTELTNAPDTNRDRGP